MNKPRIAILHYASPPTVGGVEFTIAKHARLFADHGNSVKVLTGRGETFDSRIPVELVADVDSKASRVLETNSELEHGIVGERFQSLASDLTRTVGQALEDVDVLIAHNVLSLHKNLALTVALNNLITSSRLRLIAWCHDFALTDQQYAAEVHPGFPWDLLKQPWQNVKYVVVSQASKKELLKLWGNEATEISVVPPGIDALEFFQVTEETARWTRNLKLFDASPLLLFPARLTRRKNIEQAIEIVAALRELGLKPKLVVTGPPGPHNPKNIAYLETLRALRKQQRVKSDLIFLHEFGRVSGAVMRDLYCLADALLFASEREGFGIPLLEAGLARLPIFCADIAPFREIAGQHAQYFSHAEKPEAIAARIANYFENDSTYQLKQQVRREYFWEHIFSERIEPLVSGE